MPSSPPRALPPQPPDVRARLSLSVPQRIGIPVLVIIPLLALAGLFGEARATRVGRAGPLAVTARVPARLRYRQRMTLDLAVANGGHSPVTGVRVRIDSAYLDRFSAVSLSLPVSPDGSVDLDSLAPNASALLRVTLEGDRAGAIPGAATVTDAQGDTVRMAFQSIVLP